MSAGGSANTLALKKCGTKVIQQLNAVKAEAARHDEELAALGKRLEILDSSTLPKYIVSDKYRKWHVCLNYVDVPIKDMETRCGWRYGSSIYDRKSFIPETWKKDERCPRCFHLAEGVGSQPRCLGSLRAVVFPLSLSVYHRLLE